MQASLSTIDFTGCIISEAKAQNQSEQSGVITPVRSRSAQSTTRRSNSAQGGIGKGGEKGVTTAPLRWAPGEGSHGRTLD